VARSKVTQRRLSELSRRHPPALAYAAELAREGTVDLPLETRD